MYNHNKAQQSKNRVHISWDILYLIQIPRVIRFALNPLLALLPLQVYNIPRQLSSTQVNPNPNPNPLLLR